jgi:hypothetical protein
MWFSHRTDPKPIGGASEEDRDHRGEVIDKSTLRRVAPLTATNRDVEDDDVGSWSPDSWSPDSWSPDSWSPFNHAPSHESTRRRFHVNLLSVPLVNRDTSRPVMAMDNISYSRVCAISQTHSMSPFYNRISFPIMSVRSGLFRQTHSLSHPTLTPLLASTLSIVHRRAATYHNSACPTHSMLLALLLTLPRSRFRFSAVSCPVALLRGPYHWLYTCYTVVWTGSIALVDVALRRRRRRRVARLGLMH